MDFVQQGMNVEKPSLIGPRTIIFDSEESYKPFMLGGWATKWEPDWRFRDRVDDSWWLVDFDFEPIDDEYGAQRQVARFEIGEECRYRLSPKGAYSQGQ